ncbi:MAG: ClpXP protease specificity-enhancing factor [Gammaproteobacteria bacterium]|nr:ClpXP protease specificity-enhancing factor [Gammaproteobacteria bacterium]
MSYEKPTSSSKPYLLRAIYEWLLDNDLTPYVMVDAMQPNVSVPERYIEDGRIVLNITPRAVAKFLMSNEAVEFEARFGGVAYHVYVPVRAVAAIYAFENGRGMVFSEDEVDTVAGGGDNGTPPPSPPAKPPRSKGRPNLKVIK